MPSYIVADPTTGQKYQLDGDRPPPTDEELKQIFAPPAPVEAAPVTPIPSATSPSFMETVGHVVNAAATGALQNYTMPLKEIGAASAVLEQKMPIFRTPLPMEEQFTHQVGSGAEALAQKVLPSTVESLKDSFWATDVPSVIGQVGGLIAGGFLEKLGVKAVVKTAESVFGKEALELAARKALTTGEAAALKAAGREAQDAAVNAVADNVIRAAAVAKMFGSEGYDALDRELLRQQEAGEPESLDKALAKSLGYATVATAIENKWGAGRLMRKFGFSTADEAVQGLRALAKRGVAIETLKDIALNFGEEATQRLAQDLIVDGYPNVSQIFREGAGGAVAGGLFGGTGNVLRRRAATRQEEADMTAGRLRRRAALGGFYDTETQPAAAIPAVAQTETEPAQTPVAAPKEAAGDVVPSPPALKPLPSHQVIVQKLGRPDGKGDGVQIDFMEGTSSTRSTNPEELRREGYNVPDYMALPQGKYTGEQAVAKLETPAEAATTVAEAVLPKKSEAATPEVTVADVERERQHRLTMEQSAPNGAKAVLESLSNQGAFTGLNRDLVTQLLQSYDPGAKVTVGGFEKTERGLEQNRDGDYRTQANQIAVYDRAFAGGASAETFLHEYSHAMTHRALDSGEFDKDLQPIFTAAMTQATKEGKEFHALQFDENQQPNYHELLSGAWSSAPFQEFLQSVKLGEQTLWQKFVGWVQRVLGIQPQFTSALDELIRVGRKVIAANETAPVTGTDKTLAARITSGEELKQRVELSPTSEAATLEAQSAGAQSNTVLDIYDRVNGGKPVSPQVERWLGLKQLRGVQLQTSMVLSPKSLEQLLNTDLKGAPVGLRQRVMRDVWTWLLDFRRHVTDREELYKKQLAYVTSPAFIEKFNKEVAMKRETEIKAQIAESVQRHLIGAIAKSTRALQEKGRTEAAITEIQRNLRDLNNLKDQPAAVAQKMDDIAETLSGFGDGQRLLLLGGTQQEFIDAYMSVLRQTNEPVKGDPALYRVAAFVLSRSQVNRQRLAAYLMLRKDPAVVSTMTGMQKNILESLRKNPEGFMERAFKAVTKDATNEEKARAAWLAIHREVVRELRRLDSLGEAVKLGKAILNDADFKRNEKRIVTELGALVPVPRFREVKDEKGNVTREAVIQAPQEAGTRKEWFKMDGTPITVDLAPEAADIVVAQARLSELAEDYADWLSRPENLDLPWAPSLQMEFAVINGLLRTSIMRHPPKTISLWRNRLAGNSVGQLRFILQEIGTPLANVASNIAGAWEHQSEYMEQWFKDHKKGWKAMQKALLRAADSHGLTKHRGALGTTAGAVKEWYEKIGREYAAKLQDPTYKVKVGDVMMSGYEITREDIEAFRLQRDHTTSAYLFLLNSMRPVVTGNSKIKDDILPGLTVWRNAIDGGSQTLPRTFAHDHRSTAKTIIEKLKDKPAELVAYLDENWPLVEMFLGFRNPDFIKATDYESAFRLAAEDIKEDNRRRLKNQPTLGAPTTVAELVDYLADRTLNTREESQKALLDGIVEQAQKVYDVTGKGGEQDVSIQSLELDNSFTQARGKMLANAYFYDTGFHTLPSALSFRDGGASYYLDLMRKALERVLADLQQISDETKAKTRGDEPAKLEAAKQARDRLFTGQSSLDPDRLQRSIDELDKFIKALTETYYKGSSGHSQLYETHKFRRALSGIISAIVTSGSMALANVAGGTAQMGMILAKLENSLIKGYSRAIGLQLMSALSTAAIVPTVSVRAGLKWLGRGGKDFLGMVEEIYNDSFRMLETDRLLEKAGLITPTSIRDRVTGNLRMLATGGDVTADELPTTAHGRVLRSIGMGWMAITDAALALADPLQPRPWDAMINRALFWGSNDLMDKLEARLRDTFREHENDGRFDWTPVGTTPAQRAAHAGFVSDKNRVTAQELWPAKLFGVGGGNANNMVFLEDLLGNRAQVPFQEAAWRFLKALHDAKPEDRPKVRFLDDRERLAVASAFTFEANKATRINRPIQYLADQWFGFVFTLRGWGFNALKKTLTWGGRATVDPQTAGWLLKLTSIAFILSACVASGALGSDGAELLRRLWARYLRREERATKVWWEGQSNSERAMRLAISATSQLGLLSDLLQWGFVNVPGTARASMLPLGLGKLQDIISYGAGVAKTGDPLFGADKLVKGFLPDSAIILNRLPSISGTVDRISTVRVLKQTLDPALVQDRGMVSGGGINWTPLSPDVEAIVNAIFNGNTDEAAKLHERALAKADSMDAPGEEGRHRKLLDQAIASRAPLKSAAKLAVQPDQLEAAYGRMSDTQRAVVEQGLQRWSEGIAALGLGSGGGRGGGGGIKLATLPGLSSRRTRSLVPSRTTKGPRTIKLRTGLKTGPQPVRFGRTQTAGRLRLKALRLRSPARRLRRAEAIG